MFLAIGYIGEGFAQRDRNGTQEAQEGHKKHKKWVHESIFCALCVLLCAFCDPSLFRWAKPSARQNKRNFAGT
jgi:hypothetical protein